MSFFSNFFVYSKRKDLGKLIFHLSWLHRISFTHNPTASFSRYKIVEWPWIQNEAHAVQEIFIQMWLSFQSNLLVLNALHLFFSLVFMYLYYVFFCISVVFFLLVCVFICLYMYVCMSIYYVKLFSAFIFCQTLLIW